MTFCISPLHLLSPSLFLWLFCAASPPSLPPYPSLSISPPISLLLLPLPCPRPFARRSGPPTTARPVTTQRLQPQGPEEREPGCPRPRPGGVGGAQMGTLPPRHLPLASVFSPSCLGDSGLHSRGAPPGPHSWAISVLPGWGGGQALHLPPPKCLCSVFIS